MGEQYIQLLNDANGYLGFFNDKITQETINAIEGLTEEQQKALFNQMLLLGQQRGHENIFSQEKNSFRDFIIDGSEFGWTIQDYMLEILDGVMPQWVDGNYTDQEQASNLVKDYEQKVLSELHYKPFRNQFATTVNDKEYKKSFYPSKLGSFIDRKLGNLVNSAEIWLKDRVLIDVIMEMVRDDNIVLSADHTLNTSTGILGALEKLKTDYEAFSQNNHTYNKMGKVSITPTDKLKYIITKASVMNRISVREYSGAFNLDQMKLDGRIIYVPEDYDLGKGSNGQDVLFVLVDRRAIVVAIQMWRASNFYVANQYKTNHWLGVEGVRGYNKFINAVAYTGEALGNFQ